MIQRIDTIEVNGSPMEVFIFEPQGAGPHPGLMQCMHIPVGHTGIENDSFTLKSAQRYADNGYVVAVPFSWPEVARSPAKLTLTRTVYLVLSSTLK